MRSKVRSYGGKPNKTKLIAELLLTGLNDIHELKRQVDFTCGGETSLSYIKRQKSVLKKKVRGDAVDNAVKSLPKVDKDMIVQAVKDAIWSISTKAKDIKDERVIGDLFSDILHLGGGSR